MKAAQAALTARVATAGEKFTFFAELLGGEQEVHSKSVSDDVGTWVCCTCGVLLINHHLRERHIASPAPKVNRMQHVIGPTAHHVLAWRNDRTGRIEIP